MVPLNTKTPVLRLPPLVKANVPAVFWTAPLKVSVLPSKVTVKVGEPVTGEVEA